MPDAPFPPTHRSLVEAAASPDPVVKERAWDALSRVYWRPVFTYARLAWRLEDAEAEDLTQEFFSRAFTKGFFDSYDPARARFRTFVRVCVDRLAANRRRAASRQKRGGDVVLVPLDIDGPDGPRERPLPGGEDPDALFRTEWVRSLLGTSVERLREVYAAKGHEARFAVFSRYDLEGPDRPDRPSYADLAEELGLTTAQVTNYLHGARRDFRQIVLATLRDMSGSDAEYRSEARELLGMDPT